ncbi:FkbM family methyltransferase [Kiloniella litopenaei]|uniref:FkbM family methyltransferase n=1 Tax=Kiloniella litopenaei TaxID=1549748 RepID=UPI003BA97231
MNKTPSICYKTPDIDINSYQYRPPFYEYYEDNKKIVFVTPTELAQHRAENILKDEPETIEWIRSFSPEDTMFDIGANVGGYSLYAAIMKSAQVYAFEPESQSYGILNHNLFRNKVCDQIKAYNIGLSDQEGFTQLYLNYFGGGVSCSAVGEALCNYDAFNEKGLEEFTPKHVQGVFTTTVDSLVYKHAMPTPDHIKIDVDGFEHKLISGASRLLREGKVKSLLIEINQFMPEHKSIIDLMESYGYKTIDYGTANFVFRK